MKADEFLKRVQPAVHRSKLAPYLEDIRKLRAADCTLEQVCEFLKENGVTVSVAGLSAYLRRQSSEGRPAALPAPPAAPAKVAEAAPASTPATGLQDATSEGEETTDEADNDLAGKSKNEQARIRRERKARAVIDTATNPVLKILKDQTK